MSIKITTPKVFISYSWHPTLNKEKVILLAERLSSNYVHVIIDVWDLKVGQDKNLFMEQMVNSPEITKVLLICNKYYAEKANKRVGGVGIESMIISNEIYNQAEQTKFLPIIFEFDEQNNPYIPTFVNGRTFIDLSNDEVYEQGYEQLMRTLFDKPAFKRPPLGPPPSYIQNDDIVYLPTAHKVSTIKKALLDERKNTILFIQEYYNAFLNTLPSFIIKEGNLTPENYDEMVSKSINDLSALRDDFLNFLEVYLSYSIEINVERLHDFFEKLLDYLLNLDGIGADSKSFGSIKNDAFRFFYYELFLYFTCTMFEKERFTELAHILYNPFIIHIQRTDKTQEYSFAYFRNHVATLNILRKGRLNLNRISVTADLIKERATGKIRFQQIQQADGMLYYLSVLQPNEKMGRHWFPETTCYDIYSLPLMKKAISQKYFDKLKPIFEVHTKEELIEKVNDANANNRDRLDRFNYELPQINYGLNLDNLCTIR